MKKLFAIACVGAMLGSVAMADSDSLLAAFQNGAFDGEVGVVYTAFDYSDMGSMDDGMLFGYVELGFQTDAYCGLTLGTRLVGVGELITDSDDFYDMAYMTNAALAEAWVQYAIPNTESAIVLGRGLKPIAPVMDGDVYEGVQLSVGDIPCVELTMQAITGWALNLSTDIDGDGFGNIADDDLFQGVADPNSNLGIGTWGDYVLAAAADITIVADMLSVMPFVVYQDGVSTTYGVDADLSVAANEELTILADLTAAIYAEDTIRPNDDDTSALLARVGAEMRGFSGGVSYYTRGDDFQRLLNADLAIGMKAFQPTVIVGDYFAFRDESTWIIDGGWQGERIGVSALYAWCDFDAFDVDMEELDVAVEVELLENVTLKGYFATADIEGDNMQEVGIGAIMTY